MRDRVEGDRYGVRTALRDMTPAELDAAWDLWFEVMQSTNDDDPPKTHGVFAYLTREELGLPPAGR